MIAFLLLASALAPIDVVRNAVAASEKAEVLRQQYGFTQENIQRSPDKTTTKTYEITVEDGKQYRRLTRRDGKPVSEKAEPYLNRDHNRQEMLGELTKAFDYTFGPDETVDGYECWQLYAKPKPGYKPPSAKMAFLTQMEGKVWITKKHSRLVRVDALTTGPVNFGWFLVRVASGAKIYMEQAHVEDDVWLTKHFKMVYDARLLFKTVKGEIESTSSNFKKINPST